MRDIERLSAFATSAGPFPPEVLDQARRLVLDQLACQIAGATYPWSRAVRDGILSLGPGQGATVVWHGDALAVDQAAFVNSAFGHAIEFDDTHLPSMTHPSTVIVPAVLALAEQRRLSGRAVLEAGIVGTEVLLRIAWAASPFLMERGHYATAGAGPFGAAAACSRLLGLDAATCVQALGVAGSHAAGLMEYQRGGGSVKRIHSAIPAMGGLRSAALAAHGLTGPATVLDGERGFFPVFAGRYEAARIADGLGERYLLNEISFKPIACNFSIHAAVEALDRIVREHGLAVESIAAIEVGAARSTLRAVGTTELPRTVLGAQSSLAFSLAIRLLRGGNDLDHYHEEDLADERFAALARRVSFAVDPECDEEQPRLGNRSAVVTVVTTGGRRLQQRVRHSKGTPHQPLSDAELEAKFFSITEPRLGRQRANELLECVQQLDELDDVGSLLALTRATSVVGS